MTIRICLEYLSRICLHAMSIYVLHLFYLLCGFDICLRTFRGR